MTGDTLRGDVLLAGGRRFGRPPGPFSRLFAGGFHRVLDQIDHGLETGSIEATLPDGSTRLLGGRTRRATAGGVIGLALAIGLLAIGGVGALLSAFVH